MNRVSHYFTSEMNKSVHGTNQLKLSMLLSPHQIYLYYFLFIYLFIL